MQEIKWDSLITHHSHAFETTLLNVYRLPDSRILASCLTFISKLSVNLWLNKPELTEKYLELPFFQCH